MERNYKVGDIIRIEMKTAVYQIVKEFSADRVFVRQVFDKKLNFKLGKAVLYHRSWLHGLSKEYKQKVDEILDNDSEIKAQIDDLTLDPAFFYSTWFPPKSNFLFYRIKDADAKILNQKLEEKLGDNPTEKKLDKLLKEFERKKIIHVIKTRLTNERCNLNDDESVYRVEVGRYETDFDQNGKPFFRTARLYKIKNSGISKIPMDQNSLIGFIDSE